MTQRKMLQITAGALLLLLPWFGGLASGELSDRKFTMCQKFFYNKIPPKGFGSRHQAICQRYNNQYRFATLYEDQHQQHQHQHRTALYSAYVLSRPDGKRPKNPTWMYEPQLVSKTGNREMQPFPNPISEDVNQSQAVLDDYLDSNYTRGHLAPSQHLKTMEDREASFTLTNIVPQRNGSNNGTWSKLETEVLKRFNICCNGQMYVITGTIPFQPVRMLRERVSIPEYIWSAYCCPSYKSDPNHCEQHFFPTYAAVGRNDPNSGEEIVQVDLTANDTVRGYDVRRMSLEKLERILEKRLAMSISLFDRHCQK